MKFSPDVALPTGQTCRAAAEAAQTDVIWTVGTITLAIGIIAAIVAYFTQETYRIHMNDLGDPNARPVPLEEYNRLRAEV